MIEIRVKIKFIRDKLQNCRTGKIGECSDDDLYQFAANSKWSSRDKARVIAWNKDACRPKHLDTNKKITLKCSVVELLR